MATKPFAKQGFNRLKRRVNVDLKVDKNPLRSKISDGQNLTSQRTRWGSLHFHQSIGFVKVGQRQSGDLYRVALLAKTD
jgi:hypothetical protein